MTAVVRCNQHRATHTLTLVLHCLVAAEQTAQCAKNLTDGSDLRVCVNDAGDRVVVDVTHLACHNLHGSDTYQEDDTYSTSRTLAIKTSVHDSSKANGASERSDAM